MSETIQEQPSVQTDQTIPVPPPRKKTKVKRRARRPKIFDGPPNPAQPPLPRALISLEDIQAAKAIIAQAEAALGVSQVKKEAPVPLHPQSLEDPAQGDKTPAVVEWYHKNAPEEYNRRYAGRKTHLEDRRKERPYQPLPAGATPASFPADPDGFTLSQRDDSGIAPRNFRDI